MTSLPEMADDEDLVYDVRGMELDPDLREFLEKIIH